MCLTGSLSCRISPHDFLQRLLISFSFLNTIFFHSPLSSTLLRSMFSLHSIITRLPMNWMGYCFHTSSKLYCYFYFRSEDLLIDWFYGMLTLTQLFTTTRHLRNSMGFRFLCSPECFHLKGVDLEVDWIYGMSTVNHSQTTHKPFGFPFWWGCRIHRLHLSHEERYPQ